MPGMVVNRVKGARITCFGGEAKRMMQQSDCVRSNWIVGAIFGLVVLLFVSGLGDLHWLAGLFLGVVTFALLGGLLVWLTSGSVSEPFDDDAGLIEAAETLASRSELAPTVQPEVRTQTVEAPPAAPAEAPLVAQAAAQPAPAAAATEKPRPTKLHRPNPRRKKPRPSALRKARPTI
ncbi:hypothetical protein [Paracoccus cavernae]|uniref:hypothetical protein n=1 Tax=Paracoccus cavernae TaxID=1571207 RepID=UPI003632CBFB